MNIAIQGLDTSFHAVAAKRIFGANIQLNCRQTFKDVFTAIEDGTADAGVVAIENSLYGSINTVYDLLLDHSFTINGETYEEIGLHLLAPTGATLSTVTNVYSQAPAIGESQIFLDEHLPNAKIHEHADTAMAAKQVAEWGSVSNAAIAGKYSAEKYGLSTIARNIESHHQNYTRFIALTKSKLGPATHRKTSVVFSTADKPGALHAVLGVFANAGANLTKLESRPIIGEAWNYMYYVDFTLTPDERLWSNIVDELQTTTRNLRVLGNYSPGQLKKA